VTHPRLLQVADFGRRLLFPPLAARASPPYLTRMVLLLTPDCIAFFTFSKRKTKIKTIPHFLKKSKNNAVRLQSQNLHQVAQRGGSIFLPLAKKCKEEKNRKHPCLQFFSETSVIHDRPPKIRNKEKQHTHPNTHSFDTAFAMPTANEK